MDIENTEVTIKDIARILGISKSTVSRALTDHADVNPETRRRIQELATLLDYQPNIIARNLKQKHTHTLGVIVPETMNRFFAKALSGIQQVVGNHGYNTTICQSNEWLQTEQSTLRSLLAARVDGFMISVSAETKNYDHFRVLQEKKIPVVFFDRIGESLSASKVYTNNYEVAFEAVEHLIAQGCRRIALVSGPQHLFNYRNRLNGCVDALRKHHLPVKEEYIIYAPLPGTDAEQYTRQLMGLPEPPDGIFAINDVAALKMMYIIRKSGLRIPDDVAVMGFNNEDICPYLEPSLTSVDLSAEDLGKTAAETMMLHLRDGLKNPVEKIIQSKLIIRESTRRMG